ncbi:hypothetical protein C8R42DRAFT_641121 [Lentinula raphanica]|nr:hypothetical protein C8R42DRAFT_641121 [Lentinula raphanica]
MSSAQQQAESEANRRMYALNQTRVSANADFQSNLGQARPDGNDDTGRMPSPFLDGDGAGRDSMDFNPPPNERGRESGGVPEGSGHQDPPTSDEEDEDDSDYSPGRTLRSLSSVSNRSDYMSLCDPPGFELSPVHESDFDDYSSLSSIRREAANNGELFASENGERVSRKATAQRKFLESDDSSDEDYMPSRPPTQRSASYSHRSSSQPRSQYQRSGSLRPNSRPPTQRTRSDLRPPTRRSESRHPIRRSESRPPTHRSRSHRVSPPLSRRSVSVRPPSHATRYTHSRRSRSGSSDSRRSYSSDDRSSTPPAPPRRVQKEPRRAAATDAHRRDNYRRPYNMEDYRMQVDPPLNGARANRGEQELDDRSQDRQRRGRRNDKEGRDHRSYDDRYDNQIPGYQSPGDEEYEDEEGRHHRGLKRQASNRGDSLGRRGSRRRRRSRSPSPIPQRKRQQENRRRRSRSLSRSRSPIRDRDMRRRRSRSVSPLPRHRSRRDTIRDPTHHLPSFDNFRRPRHEMPDDRYNDRDADHRRDKETVKTTSRSKVPFPKVTQSVMPTSDPVGMLTSVSQAVIKVLRNGWSEPIPLGHFARRSNLLFTSHTAPQLDISSFQITEGGQVRLKNKQLHDISIMDLSINNWNEIKRNMPKAIREHLIPDDEVFPGSTEALAAAEMIENLFRIVDDQARIGEEYVPLMFYVDTKIQFWRARPERKERIDFFDFILYRDVYEAWKDVAEKREQERKEAERRAAFKNNKGNFTFQPNHSKQPFRHNAGSSSYQGKNNQNKFTKHRCIFCGGDHHSKNHTASASDYLKQDDEGVFRNSGGKRVCFSHNGLKGWKDFLSALDYERRNGEGFCQKQGCWTDSAMFRKASKMGLTSAWTSFLFKNHSFQKIIFVQRQKLKLSERNSTKK